MRAWLLDRMEGISALRLGDAPDPVAGHGEVVLELSLAALNPADRYLSEGQYPGKPAMPHILGRDGIGTVVEIGPNVTGINVGDRKVVLRGDTGVIRPGTFAQRVALSAASLVDPPAGWTDEQAAGATLVYLTAYQALTQWGKLDREVVLITGASGGVGVAATQLAAAMGHTVVGLSRNEEKSKKLRELGAAITLDPNDKNWVAILKKQLDGKRVDLAIDNIGGAGFNPVLETMGNNGRISVVGRLAGPVPQFNTATLFFRRLKIGGVAVGSYTNAESHAAWDDIVKILGAADARPVIDSVFDFEQLPEAFAKLTRGPMGKVLLKVK